MATPKEMSRVLMPEQIQNLRKAALSLVETCNRVKDERSEKAFEPKPTGTDKEGQPYKRATAAMAKAREFFSTGHQKGVAHIIAAVTGVEVDDIYTPPEGARSLSRYEDTPEQKGMAIVMISTGNNHNYELNKVAFLEGTRVGRCWQFAGDGTIGRGNYSPIYETSIGHQKSWRPATVEEINAECDAAMEAFRRRDKESPVLAGVGF